MGRTVFSLALLLLCTLPVPAAAQILGQSRLEVDDLANHPISSIPVGSDFVLKGFVQDLRIPPPNPSGVFGAVFDVPYDPGLGTAAAPITFGSFFSLIHSGSLLLGEIHDVGAYTSSLAGPGQAEQFLFSVKFHAEHAGVMSFATLLSGTPGDDFLIYGFDNALLTDQINFIPTSVTIVPEPATWALLATGLAALGVVRRRRRRA